MNGYDTKHQYLPTTRPEKHHAAVSVAGVALCFSLCITSGCAMMRSAKTGVAKATSTDSTSLCGCSCDECSSQTCLKNHASHDKTTQPNHAADQSNIAIPASPGGQPRGFPDVKPQPLSFNGVPGTWTPSQHAAPGAEFANPALAPPNDPAGTWQVRDEYDANPIWVPSTPAQKPFMPSGEQKYPRMSAPFAAPESNDLKEYRTQILILSQQISQMKTEQEAIRTSQETLQQSHEREIQELKLQQTTAARDAGLARIRELENQLQRERERELNTVDAISQFIESAVQTPVAASQTAPSNSALRKVPAPTGQPRQAQSQTSQILPTVD